MNAHDEASPNGTALRRARAVLWASVLVVTALRTDGARTQDTAGTGWKPAGDKIMTRWAKAIDPNKVYAEYPRPQLRREAWTNLNGLWRYAVVPKEDERPAEFPGSILVPFAIESGLSGVATTVGPDRALWYQTKFRAPRPEGASAGARLLLHFGAVDWQMTAWVDGHEVGRHQGGYDPFTFDITEAIQGHEGKAQDQDQGGSDSGREHELVVRVWDPTDAGFQPRGKQVADPKGIWYTSVTGIWRTVWLEWVPATSIRRLRIRTEVDPARVRIAVDLAGDASGDKIWAEVRDGETRIARATGPAGTELGVEVPDAKLWSPESPFLYSLTVGVVSGSGIEDRVESYVGVREVGLCADDEGRLRIGLNGKPLFQIGPLDQGWWPDGLYTAPSDEALRYDLEMTKRLGFNLIRKHVKVEPDRWYYHCDRLGLLVWQDMPNGDGHIRPDQADFERSGESESNYRREWAAIIDSLASHPCIVAWVPFNEGWGQFKTNEILAWTKERDPTRLVDGPSGWSDRGTGDLNDMHRYPGPAMPDPESKRAIVLGEFGGLGLPIEGHLWWNKRNWGYRTYTTREDLQSNYEMLIRRLRPLAARGLSAAVYTQTTDVEGEVNGLMTYDREIVKLDAERIARMHAWLYERPVAMHVDVIVPTAERESQVWRFATSDPGPDWATIAYDDTAWQSGPGGFGEPTTPGSVVRTPWRTSDIWLRRTFEAPPAVQAAKSATLQLRIHHDEDAEVYLNGTRIAVLSGHATEYADVDLGEECMKTLREGTNVLAVHCRQTAGGQYVDAGLGVGRPIDTKH
ncbi:MAG: hypothetical protein FJ297_11235 [Planctomycetes bacterium]|nr:hypothetical protein [Planctomycetota bacterium]